MYLFLVLVCFVFFFKFLFIHSFGFFSIFLFASFYRFFPSTSRSCFSIYFVVIVLSEFQVYSFVESNGLLWDFSEELHICVQLMCDIDLSIFMLQTRIVYIGQSVSIGSQSDYSIMCFSIIGCDSNYLTT